MRWWGAAAGQSSRETRLEPLIVRRGLTTHVIIVRHFVEQYKDKVTTTRGTVSNKTAGIANGIGYLEFDLTLGAGDAKGGLVIDFGPTRSRSLPTQLDRHQQGRNHRLYSNAIARPLGRSGKCDSRRQRHSKPGHERGESHGQ